jgi:outer membrane protein assembly factor BamC
MSIQSPVIQRLFLAIVTVAWLGGCSTSGVFESKKVDYKAQSATTAPTLDVPPDLTPVQGDERFAVPDKDKLKGTTYSQYNKDRGGAPEVGTTAVLPKLNEEVYVEHDGAQRWLVVKATPEQVWPKLKDFWTKNGFVLKVDDPAIGVMETDWNENRANVPDDFIRRNLGSLLGSLYSTSLRDKYRTRIERGTIEGTTEIFISHKGMEEMLTKDSSSTVWQPRPSDPELEAEFIKRLALSFGVDAGRATSLAGAATPVGKTMGDMAKLNKEPNGDSTLVVNEAFDRAWRRVGLALDRIGFTVEDRDRAAGVYFVRYTDPNGLLSGEKDGFFSKLKFWKSDDKARDTQTYRMVVAPNNDGTCNVVVRDKTEKPINPDSAKRMLDLLLEQLR